MPPPHTNRTIDERISGVWASIEGNRIAEAAIKATDSEDTRPKPKHLRVLLQASCARQKDCEMMAKSLEQRLDRTTSDQVILKTLATIHFVISKGGGTFREVMDTKSFIDPLRDYVPRKVVTMSAGFLPEVIRNYAKYLEERRKRRIRGKFDYAQTTRPSEYYKKASIYQLFTEIEQMQSLLTRSIFFESEDCFDNQLLVFILVTITDDVSRLFASLNDAIIVVLESFFSYSIKDARRGLKMYEKFIKNSQDIEDFLKIVKAVVRDDAVPEFRSTKTHSEALTKKLKEYVAESSSPRKQSVSSVACIPLVTLGLGSEGQQQQQSLTVVPQAETKAFGEVREQAATISAPPESARRRRGPAATGGAATGIPAAGLLSYNSKPEQQNGAARGVDGSNPFAPVAHNNNPFNDAGQTSSSGIANGGLKAHQKKRSTDLIALPATPTNAMGPQDAKSLSMDVFDPLSGSYEHESSTFVASSNGGVTNPTNATSTVLLSNPNEANYNVTSGMRGQLVGMNGATSTSHAMGHHHNPYLNPQQQQQAILMQQQHLTLQLQQLQQQMRQPNIQQQQEQQQSMMSTQGAPHTSMMMMDFQAQSMMGNGVNGTQGGAGTGAMAMQRGPGYTPDTGGMMDPSLASWSGGNTRPFPLSSQQHQQQHALVDMLL